MSGARVVEQPATEPTAAYEYVPGTAEEFTALLDVLSVLVPEEQEDAENDDA